MKRNKLWWKLALSYFLFALGALFLAAVYLLVTVTPQAISHRGEVVKGRIAAFAQLVAESYGNKEGRVEVGRMLDLLSSPQDPAIWVLDRYGQVMNASPKAQKGTIAPDSAILSRTLGGETLSGLKQRERAYYCSVPVTVKGEVKGAIYMLFPYNIEGKGNYQALLPVAKAFALIALFALCAAFFMARKIVRPLEEMTEVARKLGNGDLEGRVRGSAYSEEIKILGKTLNAMAEKLQSALLKMEEEKDSLASMEKRRRELIASISHEIRTPLSTLQGCSEALQDGIVSGEDAQKYLGVIHREVTRLNTLVSDLLELSKLEAKAVQLKKEPIDLAGLCADIIEACHQRLGEGGITAEVSGGPLMVQADPERMRQVVFNLVENAIRYCGQGSRLLIGIEGDKDKVCMIFDDEGPGVPAEDLTRLFDHFYRVEKSRSRAGGGSGLGLAVVKQLVLLHGGAIEAVNRAGGGLRIVISLPREKE
ncbi:MAG: HAMP domain-containing sensor histidine kinase [Candidatus Eremiobacteraeota bacterium]|nr:HAMP domain-containing sensor histidine kinase [Candidatus Eremiobacteraeota bacterium]